LVLAAGGACRPAPAGHAGAVAPPPAGPDRAAPPWDALAQWAAAGYAALGFADAPEEVRVEVLAQADPAAVLDEAAREFALEVLDVGPRTNAETHWIVRRALGRAAEDSPEELLAHEVERQIRSTPLWYDRRTRAVRVVGGHPLLAAPPGAGAEGAAWEPWHLMAHEVAHALQDRRAPMRDTRAATYEEQIVRKCLYEGEADLRMLALAAAVDGRDLGDAGAAWCEAELERLFERAAPSAYHAGFRHLLAAFQAGGWGAVERAVLAPEVTSRDLLAGPGVPPVRPASVGLPGWTAVEHLGAVEYEWRDEVGAWGILGMLDDGYGDAEELGELVLRWRADRLAVARRTDGVTVVMWRIVLADGAAATALARCFAHAEGTLSQQGAILDFAWSPVKALERETLEALESWR
jgi:hypothetical protein